MSSKKSLLEPKEPGHRRYMASIEKDLAMMVWETAREVFQNRRRPKRRARCILPYLYPFPVTNAMIPFRGPVSLHEKLQQQLHPESREKFKENENVVMSAAEQEKVKDTEQEHRNSSSSNEDLTSSLLLVDDNFSATARGSDSDIVFVKDVKKTIVQGDAANAMPQSSEVKLEASHCTNSASSRSISPDSMLKLQVGDLASGEQLQLPLCTVCNSGRPINGPQATQCTICRQSRRKGNKNARGSMGNRGNTQKGATKVEAGKKGKESSRELKLLLVRQPFASQIASGRKIGELRNSSLGLVPGCRVKLVVTSDDSQTDCSNVCVGTAVYTHQKEYKRLKDLPFDDILLTKAKIHNSLAKNYKSWIVHYFDAPVEFSFKKPLKQVFRQGSVKLAKKLKGPIKKTIAEEGARRLAISAAAAATRAKNKVTAATKSNTKI